MKSNVPLFLIGLLLLISGNAYAEGNCPDGYYPIGAETGQSGPQGCAPIPGYNQQQGRPQGPSLPPPQWESRSGAIATDPIKGVLGTATDLVNQRTAGQAALADCQSKGGTACKIDIAYSNGCAAMVSGDTGYNTKAAVTKNDAIQAAMKVCTAATTHCHVYYSACSISAKVQ